MSAPIVAIAGGGPAGLMAAETLATARGDLQVHVFDAMPSVGRKFLLAGKGGLNLTHAEPRPGFDTRYGARRRAVAGWLDGFDADALRAWAAGLGIATFVGSSARVFPVDMKAAPLLRAWLHRLRAQGVRFHARHRWQGWADDGALRFATPEGERRVHCGATVLALGGASWPQLGSDGAWVGALRAAGIDVAPLAPSNCGFDVRAPAWRAAKASGWTAHLAERHAGAPIKPVALSVEASGGGEAFRRQGEFVLTATGIEGSLVYAASSLLRDAIAAEGEAIARLDLLPDRAIEQVQAEVARPRGPRSLATHLKSRLGLAGAKLALLHEVLEPAALHDAARLSAAIKSLPLRLAAPRPVAEAISTAGGVKLEALDERLMARARPGVFVAGEMLDWEAPTGGYLLTACMASGRLAAKGVLGWLAQA
ncbi:MAG TPA: TIGR03862 family flavoprotein [Methylibium sp.]|uniref:TIGR03862 family flavoprotein n=1 Tax=Methylibium sp. TaxID=2067992 RepID=UPI002DB5B496|nr:TIGR03862 family flavoprotein [Methylibium sp.]HEU4460654.1 TIGR03862 family flavoprotein [Methylibium sp.]